jgi:DNA-directed RNA polymerase subunit F
MIGKEVLGKRPVSIYEVEELLKDIEDLTYEQKASLDYVREVKKVDLKKAREKIEALKELGLDEELAVKIVNVYPKTAVELHAILAKEKVGEDLYEKILEVLAS